MCDIKNNEKNNQDTSNMKIDFIDIKKINTNPYQPRKFFSKNSLKNLTDSIKKYGLLQPIALRKISIDLYEIISGERRFRACKLLNYDKIPAVIINLNQKQCLYISLIENIQRNNLNYLEEAEGIKNIMLDCAVSIKELAIYLGQSENYILRKLYLLNLSKDIQAILLENNIPEEYAFALLKLNSNILQHEILDKIIYYGLSIKTTKKLINKILKRDQKNNINILKNKSHISDLRIFFNTIKQAVNITKSSGFDTKYIIKDDLSDSSIKISIEIKK